MRSWIDVATLAHTKNLNGGLVARAASGLPLLLSEGARVALVPPVLDAPRDVTVARISPRSEGEALVFFEEVETADVAELLVGCHCLMRRDEVDLPSPDAASDLPSWEGWSVHDVRAGRVGEVEAVEDRPLQPLLVVARAGGSPALVPLVEEFVVRIDEDARRIELDCPAGLLDL
ncbi:MULTISPECIES: ribosome maturation factor RimM [unclassified Adlercreutzia]|uniref:ribosome maturation factor RimM n=1 Tax=unclassified Adlercreutzia TaxID=2636013 RepID=UPI0013EAEDF4|nr:MULTISPECIES: 16S rRNA processing protein RimM [unclassified Adlercreutzia]